MQHFYAFCLFFLAPATAGFVIYVTVQAYGGA